MVNCRIFVLLFSQLLFADPKDPSFTRIGVKDGLPHAMVRSIHRDMNGFMWFATSGGLCRFDGYKYQTFKHYTGDSSSISSDFVFDVIEDQNGAIWAATYSGLNKYDKKKDSFYTLYIDENINTSKPTNSFLKSEIDSNGDLWTLVINKGLLRLEKETGKFKRINLLSEAALSLPDNVYITAFDVADSGHIWLAFSKDQKGLGLYRYNIETKEIFSYSDALYGANTDDLKRLTCVFEDRHGNVWVGYNSGLDMLNVKSGTVTHHIPSKKFSQIQASVEAIEEDDQGMIWIATSGNGLLKLDPTTGGLNHFINNPKNNRSISSNYVLSLFDDRKGTLWIGTDKGLNRVSLRKKAFQNYLYAEEEDQIQSANFISDLCTDPDNLMWFCTAEGLYTYDGKNDPVLKVPQSCRELVRDSSGKFWFIGGGLFHYDPATDKTEQFTPDVKKHPSFSASDFWSLYKDHEEVIWMGTGGNGLYSLDLKTLELTHYLHEDENPNTISSNEVGPIFRNDNELWIGPFKGGLNCLDLKTGKINKYVPDPNDPESLSHSVVSAIHKDKKGRMWIGTNQGLNLLNAGSDRFLRIQEKDGLASNYISVNGISEDKKGNIWVATNEGISKINSDNLFIRNYDSRDGFQKNPLATIYQDANGKLFLYGENGITVFQPENIKDNSVPPQVSITDFLLFNKSLVPGENSPIKEEVSEAEEVRLSYEEDFFTIEFAAHNYILSEKNQYAYRLEGFEDWTYSGTRRYAYYTNIPPGSYTFRVKAANNDGVWNEQGKALKIVITPPFWQTTWFRIVAGIFIALSLYGLYRWRTYQLYLQRKQLEHLVTERTREVEAQKEELSTIAEHLKLSNREITLKNKKIVRQANKLKVIDQLKSQFVTNISHEFRTPLTLILCPLEEMIAKLPTNTIAKAQLNTIEKNAKRLLNLINQLLDLSKIENGTLPLEKVHSNLLEHLRAIAFSFNYLAEKHNIHYKFVCEEEELFTDFDPDKIEKIFYNLISNAFKFTPDGGEICLNVRIKKQSNASPNGETSRYVKIEVVDNGVGISSRHLPNIFDRFYQAEDTKTRKTGGTGVGLALTKELVELHKGKIKVESESGAGSRFTVFLPITHEQAPVEALPALKPAFSLDLSEVYPSEDTPPITTAKTAPLLLIVEDNEDLRNLVKSLFSDQYRIAEAVDGIEGWEIARTKIPDIIISDVMMPGRDGLSLCAQIKNDPSTSHIPTILLTAKSNSELEGLTIGADDYIIKPFSAQALTLKVKNILTTRQKMWVAICRELGVKDALSVESTTAINDHNKRFIEKASEISLKHLRDTSFEMETLYRELGMSRTLVYKKMKSLTGLSPNEFTRQIKLNKAAELLKEGRYNVSEVMNQVGFSHRSYFVNCFRKHFGKMPSEYALGV